MAAAAPAGALGYKRGMAALICQEKAGGRKLLLEMAFHAQVLVS